MKPNLGVKIPGMENNGGGGDYTQPGGGVSEPIINTLMAPQAPQTPVPQWDTANVNVVADPNKGYQPVQTDTNAIFNPNTDMSAGVPTYNTPATNQQGAPSFSLNLPYQSTPDPSKVLNSISGAGASPRWDRA